MNAGGVSSSENCSGYRVSTTDCIRNRVIVSVAVDQAEIGSMQLCNSLIILSNNNRILSIYYLYLPRL